MLNPKRAQLNIKKVLKNAPEAKIFWTSDGKKLYNIRDLVEALEEMAEDTFRTHVNSQKNDFVQWIKLVLGEKRLARTLRWTTTLETTIEKIREHLEKYYI